MLDLKETHMPQIINDQANQRFGKTDKRQKSNYNLT